MLLNLQPDAKKQTLLLLGAKGMFGTDAAPVFAGAGYRVIEADLPEVDITVGASVSELLGRHGPGVVVNAAGFTRVDEAESHRDEAFRVNAEGAARVAEACWKAGVPLVHISTDYVFPGERPGGYLPGDAPGPPLNAYGESKLAGEEAVRKILGPDRSLICRTQWLYGRGGRNFVDTIRGLAQRGGEIRVVDDQWGVPTLAADLARQIGTLLSAGARGIAHTVGGGGPVTWLDVARAVVEFTGLAATVAPCATADFPRPARRPRHAWLRDDRLPAGAVRPWRDALREYLRVPSREVPPTATPKERQMDIRSLFKPLGRFEEKLADLYRWYAELFKGDEEAAQVFSRMALEEKNHLSLIQYEERLVKQNPKEFGEVVLDLGTIDAGIVRVEELRAGPPPTLEEAVRAAVELEGSAAEYHYRLAIKQALPRLNRLLDSLGTADRNHCENLRSFARKRGYADAGLTIRSLPTR